MIDASKGYIMKETQFDFNGFKKIKKLFKKEREQEKYFHIAPNPSKNMNNLFESNESSHQLKIRSRMLFLGGIGLLGFSFMLNQFFSAVEAMSKIKSPGEIIVGSIDIPMILLVFSLGIFIKAFLVRKESQKKEKQEKFLAVIDNKF